MGGRRGLNICSYPDVILLIPSVEKPRQNIINQQTDLEKRENELKEKALRNKVVRTRKSSVGGNS
jgi:serine/arginine repetitive matrix protein 1